jgi:membrane-associated phospholipid phosphatase
VRIVAKIISLLFHPLLLTSYLVTLIGFYFPTMLMVAPQNMRPILAFIFCFTFILPAVNIIMFRIFGTISTYTMESRRERIVPFIAISVTYVVMTFLFYFRLPFSSNFNNLMLLVTLLVVTGTIITFFYKVSIHSLAMWGGIGIIVPLNKAMEQSYLLWPTAGIIIAAGLVMSARLYLDAHTPRQVMIGGVVGFGIGFLGMIFLF